MKFLRSYYKNKKVIMAIDGCHNCPLMRLNGDTTMCTCRIFIDKRKNENVVDDWAINYNSFGTTFDSIKIPKWCELPDTMTDMFFYKFTYRPNPTSIEVSSSDDNNDYNLDVVSIRLLKKENINIIYKILNDNQNTPNDDDFDEYPFKDELDYINNFHYLQDGFENEDSNNNGVIIELEETCSLCGENHATVDRIVNNGMCDPCYDLYKDDKTKMNQSYINNFRLKRKVNILHEPFKMVN
jgi:hypothetical protein